MHIKIGTRGSKLALWQAYFVEKQLQKMGISTSIVEISTKGDKILDVSLAKIGSKGLFTEELEEMLRNGTIDIAVHSAKDVQSTLADDLELIAFTEREEANDVLVALRPVDLNSLVGKIAIGTSSTRRSAFLRHYYPHLQIVDMRGNLQTRFEKLKNGACDAMILAFAGVHRLNFDNFIVQKLPFDNFTPPVGQGCIGVECSRLLDEDLKNLVIKAINHSPTAQCIRIERDFLKTMQGGCSVPTFGYANYANANEIDFRAGIISLDGSKIVREFAQFPLIEAEHAGEAMAKKVLAMGGKEILETIKKTQQ
ncbi:MAG: hydroxymethylbilane synthase [Cytophagales bacterium]